MFIDSSMLVIVIYIQILILCTSLVVLPYSHATDGFEWTLPRLSSNRKHDSSLAFSSSLSSSLLLSSSSSLSCGVTSTDYNALNDLYTSTNGSNWYTYCNNWKFTSTPNYAAPCNGWYGVTCNSQCVVTGITLYECGLKGSIPSSIGSLTGLNDLYLFDNSLTGSIPSSIGSLTKLTQLYLSSNSLVGNIPFSITSLTGLTYLNLSTNSLTGSIPSSIGNLKGLDFLDICSNSLTGSLPLSIGSLTKLTAIYLDTNSLTGSIPISIGSLTGLNTLYIYDNRLTGSIPSSIGSLTGLGDLYLNGNNLTGSIPSSIGSLTGLYDLELFENSLTGSIPSSIGSLTRMYYLQIYSNSLTGSIPSSIGSLTELKLLNLSRNSLTGSIPPSIRSLTKLSFLDLCSNSLTSIPSNSMQGTFSMLIFYRLSNNSLSGTIPSTIASMTSLNYLYIDGNHLTGTIPSEISALSTLIAFYSQRNQLEGSVPVSLFSLPNLTYIDLSFNSRLTASINSLVDVISPSSQISYINLAGIQLTGSLPAALFSLPQLTTLILANSCISGTIPITICKCNKLKYFSMDGLSTAGSHCKHKHGSIPACLFSLPSLKALHLVGNDLTGSLSDVPINSKLSTLNVAKNRLTGTIPQSIQWHRFDILDVSFNKITGTLIDSFNVPNTSLRMMVNRLSGTPPSSFVQKAKNTNLNVLEGNLFGCPLLTSDINSDSSKCGSDVVEHNFIIWLSLVASIGCLVAVEMKLQVLKCVLPLRVKLLQWCKTYYSSAYKLLHHTKRTIDNLERGCSLSFVLVLGFVLIVMSSYIGIKYSGNYIYQVQYLYTTTAAYTVGSTQVVLIWIFLSLSALSTIIMCILIDGYFHSTNTGIGSASVQRIAGENDQTVRYKDMLRRVGGEIGLELVVLALSVGVNAGYVGIVYFIKPSNLSLVQFAFAIMKSLFSWMAPIVTRRLPKTSRQLHALFMTVGINILGPGIATLYISPLCLYYKFNPIYISPLYEYPLVIGTCTVTESDTLDCTTSHERVTSSLTVSPPWNYSYQCSSSFLTSYLPNFVFLYIIHGIIYPLIRIFIMTIVSKNIIIKIKEWVKRLTGYDLYSIYYVIDDTDEINATKANTELKMIPYTVNNKNDINETSAQRTSSVSNKNYTIEAFGIMSGMCLDITLLLTFGLASPLLAVLIAWSMVINTLLFRLAVGRYIFIVSKAIGVALCHSNLDDALRDEWQCLSRSWWIMTILIGLFWSLFVNDMIGDRDHTGGIVAALLMMVWCPLVFISTKRLLVSLKRRIPTESSNSVSIGINSDSNRNTSRSTFILMYMESVVLSVHKFIWTRVLRIGSVRDVVEGSDDNRDSTISETTSPLGTLHTSNRTVTEA